MIDKKLALLILTHCHGLGGKKIRQLIREFGSVNEILEMGWDKGQSLLFKKWKIGPWEKDLELIDNEGANLISYEDPQYPKKLLEIEDYPLLLYVKGRLSPQNQKSLAIVGTRAATLYGQQRAQKIAQECAAVGIVIISGLARGIDTAAHVGALKGGGITLAVIGSGLNSLYPKENAKLSDEIAQTGAVISEYPMSTPPAKGLFPRRNRIVSALCDGICLIESPIEGGGMITMEIGALQKKPLYALPGRVDWPTFAGNHHLIKTKKATLIENSEDIIKNFNIPQTPLSVTKEMINISIEEKIFLERLPEEEKTVDELVLLTQLPIMQLNVLLTRLVLKKLVKEFPGKIYKKVII